MSETVSAKRRIRDDNSIFSIKTTQFAASIMLILSFPAYDTSTIRAYKHDRLLPHSPLSITLATEIFRLTLVLSDVSCYLFFSSSTLDLANQKCWHLA